MFTHIGRGGRTGMYIRVGAYYIHTTHAAVYNIGIRVEFHERFKIGMRKPNKNNNILLYTAAENIIILYRVIETGRKKKQRQTVRWWRWRVRDALVAETKGCRSGADTQYIHILLYSHTVRVLTTTL